MQCFQSRIRSGKHQAPFNSHQYDKSKFNDWFSFLTEFIDTYSLEMFAGMKEKTCWLGV